MDEPRFVMTVVSSEDYEWTEYHFKMILSPLRSVGGEHEAYRIACQWVRDNLPLHCVHEGGLGLLSLSIDKLEHATMFRLRWC